jgi:hypothetical protein
MAAAQDDSGDRCSGWAAAAFLAGVLSENVRAAIGNARESELGDPNGDG